MAVISNIPGERQPSDAEHLDESNARGFSSRFKGLYSELQTFAGGLSQGDTFEGHTLKTWNLERAPGNLGVLTLAFVPDAGSSSGAPLPIEVRWSVKSVRNDKSIFVFCGPSEGNDPQRPHIELWMKETDPDAIAHDQYTGPDGTKWDLTDPDMRIVNKLKRGIESVIRFYPIVTRTNVYTSDPADSFSKLGFIDDLPDDAPSIEGSYQWLKCQDDKEKQPDGNWQRVESWMGALESDGGWDADLYGANRWEVPS